MVKTVRRFCRKDAQKDAKTGAGELNNNRALGTGVLTTDFTDQYPIKPPALRLCCLLSGSYLCNLWLRSECLGRLVVFTDLAADNSKKSEPRCCGRLIRAGFWWGRQTGFNTASPRRFLRRKRRSAECDKNRDRVRTTSPASTPCAQTEARRTLCHANPAAP